MPFIYLKRLIWMFLFVKMWCSGTTTMQYMQSAEFIGICVSMLCCKIVFNFVGGFMPWATCTQMDNGTVAHRFFGGCSTSGFVESRIRQKFSQPYALGILGMMIQDEAPLCCGRRNWRFGLGNLESKYCGCQIEINRSPKYVVCFALFISILLTILILWLTHMSTCRVFFVPYYRWRSAFATCITRQTTPCRVAFVFWYTTVPREWFITHLDTPMSFQQQHAYSCYFIITQPLYSSYNDHSPHTNTLGLKN